jgi:hypothetical protein
MLLLAGGLTGPATAAPDVGVARLRLVSPHFRPSELRAAAETWRRGCPASVAGRLPDLVVDGPGIPVLVRRLTESSSPNGRCGQTRLQLSAGRLMAAQIDIFARQSDGRSCLPLEDEIAHELGHVFGLHDDRKGPRGAIMGPRRAGERRQVTAEECADALASRRLRSILGGEERLATLGDAGCAAGDPRAKASGGGPCDSGQTADLRALEGSRREQAGGSGPSH